MQKILFLFFMWTIISTSTAQKRYLEVDCKSPGWLASYMNPDEAQNATNLKIKGTINSEDFKVIGNLMKNYKLQGSLDLTDATIVDTEKENYFSGEMFGVENCSLQYFALPQSLVGMEKGSYWGKSDTLVVGGQNLPDFGILDNLGWQVGYNDYGHSNYGWDYTTIGVKHLIIRDGVQSITAKNGSGDVRNTSNNTLESIFLPESILTIGHLIYFHKLSAINTPLNVEYLGSLINTKVFQNTKTFYVPSKVKTFYSGWVNDGYLGEGGVVNTLYLPKNLENFNLSNINEKATISIHCKSKVAPKIGNPSSISLQRCVVYVPSGYEDIYKAAHTWKNATIIGEVYADEIIISTPFIYKDDDCTLNATVLPSNTTFKDFIWESSNDSVVTIDNSGKAHGVNYGTAQITVYSSDKGCSNTVDVYVYAHTSGIQMDKSKIDIALGTKFQLVAKTLPLDKSDNRIEWNSSNSNIATVDTYGNVIPISKGSCVITASSIDGGYIAQCIVSVKQPVTKLQLVMQEKELKVGDSYTLFATIFPTDADNKNIIWSSSNSDVASIENGVVTALKAGNATIYAKSEENPEICDSCKFVILQPVMGITLDHQLYTLNSIGDVIQLKANIIPENATNKDIEWRSSNENVCVVSNGKVVATGTGTSVIMAISKDGGYMATCIIKVEETTGIDKVGKEGKYLIPKIYSTDGRRSNLHSKGIKIVKSDNGKSNKVYIK